MREPMRETVLTGLKKIKANMNRQRTIHILALLLCSATLMAQNTMRVHYKDGREQDISITQIDSVTFVDREAPEEAVTLTGSWLWGNRDAGYYELLTFSDDHTYTGYDNYFTYGFDTMTYGWFSWYGNMLTLQSNGFGYRRINNWFITGLGSNALEVMTKMGRYTYHRVQPDAIVLSVGGSPVTCSDGDAFVFADGVRARIADGALFGVARGTTYVQKFIAQSNTIVSYKVVVE